jgi:hypothetical protein
VENRKNSDCFSLYLGKVDFEEIKKKKRKKSNHEKKKKKETK